MSLEIVDMKGGEDIDAAVIDGIEHCESGLSMICTPPPTAHSSLQDPRVVYMASLTGRGVCVRRKRGTGETFIVFGSASYGQDTGNPACTYYESKFAQVRARNNRIVWLSATDSEFLARDRLAVRARNNSSAE